MDGKASWHPSSELWTGGPSKARTRKPIRSSIVREAGMEAWTTGPSLQEALRGKLRKEVRDSGEPRRGGKEAGAGSLRNTEEASSLSIALNLCINSGRRILAQALRTPASWEPYQCHLELYGNHGEDGLAPSV